MFRKNSERILRHDLEELLAQYEESLVVPSKVLARYLVECTDSLTNAIEIKEKLEEKEKQERRTG